MLAAIGRFCFRLRFTVATVWLLAVVGGFALGLHVFGRLGINYSGSELESFQGYDRLSESAQFGSRITGIVDGRPVDDTQVRAAVAEAAADLGRIDGVARVVTAYTAPPEVAVTLRSADGQASLVAVDLEKDVEDTDPILDGVRERLDQLAEDSRTEVLVGGELLTALERQEQSSADLHRGEVVTLLPVLLVTVVVFGGLVAAGLPLLGAVATMAGGLAALYAASYFLDLDPSVPSVTTVMGLGLSIDYALLLLSRYREERGLGRTAEDAVAAAMATAGRTTLFSGLTVAVSLSGLLLFDIRVFRGLAVAGASAVLFALLAALTLVPALIGLARRRIGAPTRPVPDDGVFARLARATQRRPLLVASAVVGALVLAVTPFAHARYQLGAVDLLPKEFETRRFAETLAAKFPGQASAPVVVLARTDPQTLASYAGRIRSDPEIAPLVDSVGRPEARLGGYAQLAVVAKGTPQGQQAQDLVQALRDDRPSAESLVTGDAAVLVDFKRKILEALPWAALWVVLATFVLLFLMTGSILVPVKALVMNTVSLGATFGAMVWVFQDGHLASLLDFTPVEGLEIWVPVVTFAFAFGLSMDYEVFLLARIKELYDGGLPNDRAVELGLQRSGRIITSAALIMTIVCVGFATARMLDLKQLTLGLAIAVAVDATLVRCLLVPATMTLLGDRNWWAPASLRRLHARFGLHEHPGARPRGGRH
ncbi:MAG: MMPL family transporter, partial [Actinomycetota bacterium]|nr:MMPL family transporter [Actinomycetota bacterium]